MISAFRHLILFRLSSLLAASALTLTATLAFTHASSAQGLNPHVKDSQRQEILRRSAAQWFEQHVYPVLKQEMPSFYGYGVSITEPKVTLPPSLGGPLHQVQIQVVFQFSGLIERSYHSRRYPGLPEYGVANCRMEQKLWAEVDKNTGQPIRIRRGQTAYLIFACASPGVQWPQRDGRNY